MVSGVGGRAGGGATTTGFVEVPGASLFVRKLDGAGPPVVVVHGGPDFDHSYLRPEVDRLAESCRLVYYDQRGRGRSASGVRAADVTMASEVADLDAVRRHLGVDRVALLGHSWGAVVAMEYASRFPTHLSHLVLLGAAPASAVDAAMLRRHLREIRAEGEIERMHELAASEGWRRGDLSVEREYYRLHFRPTVADAVLLERILGRLRTAFTAEGVLLARAIEERLYELTWDREGYDLAPRLRSLEAPAMLLHADQDFIPVQVAAHIAESLADVRLEVLPGCGHFSFAERPDDLAMRVAAFLTGV